MHSCIPLLQWREGRIDDWTGVGGVGRGGGGASGELDMTQTHSITPPVKEECRGRVSQGESERGRGEITDGWMVGGVEV